MSLITYSRIYVCIGASLCHVIVNLVIIGSIGSSHTMRRDLPPRRRGSRCYLHALDHPFLKLALFPHPHFVATAAPTQSTAALARQQPLCQGAAAPAACVAPVGGTSTGATPISAAPTNGRAGLGRQPLASRPLVAGPCGLAVGGRPLREPYSRPPLRASRYKWLCPRAAAAPTG
ncbi:hypothetical protein GW17_00057200 [Ensete ventricosum]|nr:hypothetical protein GW17_00057200 [Ensete ventricosum]